MLAHGKDCCMPKVFTGKIAIPGDKIDEYFKALEKAEEERAPFRKSLEARSDAFDEHLASRFSQRTVRRHSMTIEMFVEFLCRQTDVQSLDEVTVGMANSHFRNWYKRKVMDNATDSDLKNGIQKFFHLTVMAAGFATPDDERYSVTRRRE